MRAAILARSLGAKDISELAGRNELADRLRNPGARLELPAPAEMEWSSITSRVSLPISESSRALSTVQRGGNLTLLVWMRTPDVDQTGPARILTYSRDPFHRNFTLGQQGRSLVFRLRTTSTGPNGVEFAPQTGPVLSADRATFIAATYAAGTSRIYVNGQLEAETHLPRFRRLVRFWFEGQSAPVLVGLLISISLLGLLNFRVQARILAALTAGALVGALSSLTAPGGLAADIILSLLGSGFAITASK